VDRLVTSLVPGEFPLLLIGPAVGLGLLWARTANWNKWLQSAVAGIVFLVIFIGVQWPFASFLMSPAARNRFFGAIYFDYNLHPSSSYVRYLFFATEPTRGAFWMEMSLAAVCAIVSARLGMAWGDWMQRIRR